MSEFEPASDKPDTPVSDAVIELSQTPEQESRRAHTRFSVELAVDLKSESNFYAGLAENLSAGGVFVATHNLQEVGSKVEITVRLPEQDKVVHAIGEVCWVRVFNEESDTPPGMGLRFVELEAGAAQLIERFVARREPLFFDVD
jgi:uncharacterized protein (TIGR02266 family)